jgi:hypothetical protein
VSRFEHFKSRNILLPESPQTEFDRLGVSEAKLPSQLLLPPLPQNYTIQNEMTAVEDQGAQGSCTSFCVIGCLEHIHQRDLSEGQTQHDAEKTYGDCQEGLAMVHSFSVCKNPGAVDEALWQYDDTQVCLANPPNVAGATRYRFTDFGYVYNRPRAAVLQALQDSTKVSATPGLPITLAIQRNLFARRKTVAVSVPVVWAAWPWSGEIQLPPPGAAATFFHANALPNVDGWHCIAICGWDNGTGRFLFKNSWGQSWGQSGYGTIPYQYIDNYSDTGIVGW